MTKKIVTASLHNSDVDRCVDIIRRPDGTFGFKEFRRDAEDGGRWTLVADHTHKSFGSEHEAAAAAKAAVVWLRDQPQSPATGAVKPVVAATLHNKNADRAVKIIKKSDGTFGCNEFRRDPEDAGSWTLVRENASGTYATQEQAVAAARAGWLRDMAPTDRE